MGNIQTVPRLRLDPPLYTWEWNDANYTRYDYVETLSEPQVMNIRYLILGIIDVILACITFTLIVSILRHPKTRNNSFNLYVMMITITDFTSEMFGSITFLNNYKQGEGHISSEVACAFQSFYLGWGTCSNMWMNALICYQIHKLLRFSNIRRKYIPPSRREAVMQGCYVYLYGFCWSIIGIFNFVKLPFHTHAYFGFVCFPMEYDLKSTLVYYLVAMNFVMGVPTTYCMYVLYNVYKYNLLPSKGKRRQLSLYILRLVFVFIFMWIPFTLVGGMLSFLIQYNPWIHWCCVVYSHVQAAVSVSVAMTKPDIQQAVLHTITCRNIILESDEVITKRRNSRRASRAAASPVISGFSTGDQLQRRGRSSLAVSFMNKFQNTMALFWGGRSSTIESTHPSTLDNDTPEPSIEKSSKRFSTDAGRASSTRRSNHRLSAGSMRFSTGGGGSRLSFGTNNQNNDRSVDSLIPLSSLPLSTIPTSTTTHHEESTATIAPMMEEDEEKDEDAGDVGSNGETNKNVVVVSDDGEIVFAKEKNDKGGIISNDKVDDDGNNSGNGGQQQEQAVVAVVAGGTTKDGLGIIVGDDDDDDGAEEEEEAESRSNDVEGGGAGVGGNGVVTNIDCIKDVGGGDDGDDGDAYDDDYDSDDSSLIYT